MHRFAFIFWLFLPPALFSQPTDSLSIKADQLIQAYVEVYGFSGTVKIVQQESPAFEKSYGLANRSFDIPNTPTTRFSINSISKVFTATAILMLVDEGKLDLEQPISTYLPTLTAPWKDTITLHHLLSHTSGLPRESGIQAHEEKSLAEQALLVDQQALLSEPASTYEYSNSGVILLGAILEKVTGTDYATFVTERIIHPLGLEHTGVYEGRKVITHQAVPYRLGPNGLEFAQRSKHYGTNAGGGLYSTPNDLYQFVLALEQQQLLSETLTELMFKPHIKSGENGAEAYAWSIQYFEDEVILFAAGSGYGTKSVMIRMPQTKDFIAITSNWGNLPILSLLMDLYLLTKGQQPTPPSVDYLAQPADFKAQLGWYAFDQELLKSQLGMDKSRIRLQVFEGRLFLEEELLARKDAGKLGLTYTNELTISFENNLMVIEINGNRLVGEKVN